MRVLYFTRSCTGHDLRFIHAFVDRNISVGFVSLESVSSDRLREVPQGVRQLGSLGIQPKPSTAALLERVGAFREIVEGFQPDVILAGPVHDCAFITFKASIRCAWIVQSWAFDVLWETTGDNEVQQRCRAVLEACPVLFADCQAVAKRCEEIGGRTISRKIVMPWGIDLAATVSQKQRSAMREELGLTSEQIFICARQLEPVYRIDVLIGGFWRLRDSGSNAVLLLTGTGSQRQQVEKWIVERKLEDVVRLVGPASHSRLMDLFAGSDHYVSAAESDGTSIALLEAMYMGLVPIVTNVGGSPEWVEDGANGFLVGLGSDSDFALAMTKAIRLSPQDRNRMIALGRNGVASKANWNTNFNDMFCHIQTLARQHTSEEISVRESS